MPVTLKLSVSTCRRALWDKVESFAAVYSLVPIWISVLVPEFGWTTWENVKVYWMNSNPSLQARRSKRFGIITPSTDTCCIQHAAILWCSLGINNYGIDVTGFGGDTMQMARLWDSSRIWIGGYSLSGLINDLGLTSEKRNIKDRFGAPKLKKDGSAGKQVLLPSFIELQRSQHYITDWVDYSTFDAEGTWYVHEELVRRLSGSVFIHNVPYLAPRYALERRLVHV